MCAWVFPPNVRAEISTNLLLDLPLLLPLLDFELPLDLELDLELDFELPALAAAPPKAAAPPRAAAPPKAPAAAPAADFRLCVGMTSNFGVNVKMRFSCILILSVCEQVCICAPACW